jgi:hypothetical protein
MTYTATLVLEHDGLHVVHYGDVIEYDGHFWLVPEWRDNRALGVTMPARIIALASLSYQKTGNLPPQFVVNDPIPKCVFDGQIPPEQAHKYIVVERPEIRLPLTPARALGGNTGNLGFL